MADTTVVTVTVEGIGPVPVTVTERGGGRPFLLLHGGAGPQSVDGFADLLAAQGRVIVPVHPGFGGTPRPQGLDSIRLLVVSELQFDPCPLIREGMMVEVLHGPLRGVVGRLMRKDAHHARLVLSVDLIGQAVSVEVDAADVRPF